MKRGGPLIRKVPLARLAALPRNSRALNRESRKRQGERDARTRVRESTLERDGHRCVAAGLPGVGPCGGPLEVDEIVSRSRRPGGHLDPTNTQSLCRQHNQMKVNESELFIELGLARHSWDR